MCSIEIQNLILLQFSFTDIVETQETLAAMKQLFLRLFITMSKGWEM